jgi:hypothetical protein
MSAAEIHHELGTAYGQNILSEGTVKQWCLMFTMKSKVVGHLQ